MSADEQPTLISVTVSINPRVEIDKYNAFKPFASVTINVPAGVLKDAHLDFATTHLRRALFAALKTEIDVSNDAQSALAGATTTEALADLCMKEIGDVATHQTFKVVQQGGGGGGVKPVQAKAPVQKAGGAKVAVAKSGGKVATLQVPASPIFGKGGGGGGHKGQAVDVEG